MGIYDREYIRKGRHGGNPLAPVLQTAVGTIILINVIAWIAQLFAQPSRGPFGFGPRDLGPVTNFLAATPEAVFNFQIWKLVTANFAHSTYDVWHILGNMLFLFFFGRELEQIYGRRDFWIFYLAAGIIAVLAEVLLLGARGLSGVPVLGASGAVMAVTVLFTLFYPNRTIALMFFIPAPVWVWCLIYIGVDLFGLLSPSGDNIAHLAHLAGAAVGALYRFLDPRWVRLSRLLSGGGRAGRAYTRASRPREGKVLAFPTWPAGRRSEADARAAEAPPAAERRDPVSQRIDDLLAKISTQGKESLTEEEWSFLRENSGRYHGS